MKKGEIKMKFMTMVKGAAILAVAGTAVYLYASGTPSAKKKLKRNAEKTLHSAEDMLHSITDLM